MNNQKNNTQDIIAGKEELYVDLERLRQNKLLRESELIRFAKDRGLTIRGVIQGEPGAFYRQGWLHCDGENGNDEVLFHPFRIYVVHNILRSAKQDSEQLKRNASNWNSIVDLAIFLEPLYWPYITGKMTWSGHISEEEYAQLLENYRSKALSVVAALDSEEWKILHKHIRLDAACVDANTELYLLLRVSAWNERKKLKGAIAAALWIRHMAEIIRLAFEEVHSACWPEEDQGFGVWMKGGRSFVYGSERPLSAISDTRHHVAVNFGLLTSSVVRWYVEGYTEYYAILALLPEPARANIELVNLKGNLKTSKDNIALKLEEALDQDRKLRRFSFISFDMDVDENVKFFRRQVEFGHVVGYIAAHRPDFEFSNFSLDELIEIAAQFDEESGFSGDCLRQADWAGIDSGSKFERRYMEVSSRKCSLKGEGWGKALAKYASEHPERGAVERPLLQTLQAALIARGVNYDQHHQEHSFNTNTFALVTRQ